MVYSHDNPRRLSCHCCASPGGPTWSVLKVAEALGVTLRTLKINNLMRKGLKLPWCESPGKIHHARSLLIESLKHDWLIWSVQVTCRKGGWIYLFVIRFTHDLAVDTNNTNVFIRNYINSPKRKRCLWTAVKGVLEVYHLPYDLDYSGVCMDESNKQMVGKNF